MKIIKVQVSLSCPQDPLLVYDREKRFVEMHDQTEAILEALAGSPKGYFEAERDLGKWVIGKRVEDQDW